MNYNCRKSCGQCTEHRTCKEIVKQMPKFIPGKKCSIFNNGCFGGSVCHWNTGKCACIGDKFFQNGVCRSCRQTADGPKFLQSEGITEADMQSDEEAVSRRRKGKKGRRGNRKGGKGRRGNRKGGKAGRERSEIPWYWGSAVDLDEEAAVGDETSVDLDEEAAVGFGSPVCQDLNDKCKYWALLKECEKSPGYMNYNCRKSCGQCTEHRTCKEIVKQMPKFIPGKKCSIFNNGCFGGSVCHWNTGKCACIGDAVFRNGMCRSCRQTADGPKFLQSENEQLRETNEALSAILEDMQNE